MIGFGWSDKPRHYRYSIFDQADLHEALMRAQGVKRYHILAHDYGDTVAQELLARHEERRATGDNSLVLESVCLLNGGLFPEMHRAARVQKLLLTLLGPLLGVLMNERGFAPVLLRCSPRKRGRAAPVLAAAGTPGRQPHHPQADPLHP